MCWYVAAVLGRDELEMSWWLSLGRISACCSCTASWPLNQQPQVTSIHLQGGDQEIYTRSDSRGENPGIVLVSYVSCAGWDILLVASVAERVGGVNIHPCVRTIPTPDQGTCCWWPVWVERVTRESVTQCAPSIATSHCHCTLGNMATPPYLRLQRSWAKPPDKEQFQWQNQIIYDKEAQVRLWPVGQCVGPVCSVTAVLVRCHRAAITDGLDWARPGQSCLTAAPCNMDTWTASHYLNWILLLQLG